MAKNNIKCLLYSTILLFVLGSTGFIGGGCATFQDASKSASMKQVATGIWKEARLQDIVYIDKEGITHDAYGDFRVLEGCMGVVVEKPRVVIYGKEGGLVQCGDEQVPWCLQPNLIQIARQHTLTSLKEAFFAYIMINGDISPTMIGALQEECL